MIQESLMGKATTRMMVVMTKMVVLTMATMKVVATMMVVVMVTVGLMVMETLMVKTYEDNRGEEGNTRLRPRIYNCSKKGWLKIFNSGGRENVNFHFSIFFFQFFHFFSFVFYFFFPVAADLYDDARSSLKAETLKFFMKFHFALSVFDIGCKKRRKGNISSCGCARQ